ncbi:MAG: c-type cytochrome [Deltaproteobacteria bacterium]|nr:c-type cytochrome [Deltaproteobacteria bacterium]
MKDIIRIFPALLLLLIAPLSHAGTDAGKETYLKRCAGCHGKDGTGNGPAARFLNPAPRDLTAGVFKWKTTPFDEPMPSGDDLYAVIAGHNAGPGWSGLGNTAMPGWSDTLSKGEIRDVAAYLKKLGGLDAPRKPSISASAGPSATAAAIETGKRLFKDRCAECHGAQGRGNGAKRLKDDWGGRTWPRDLTKSWTFRRGGGREAVYATMTVGIPGTQMPSFADPKSKKMLTNGERWAVAGYAASIDEPAKTPGTDTVVRAARTDGVLPSTPADAAWAKTAYASFFLTPQIIAGDRLYAPALDAISIKAVYNEKDIAFLVEWDDRTEGIPRDAKSMEIAGGEVEPDSVALEFPAEPPRDGDAQLPCFGMGDSLGQVNIWQWKNAVLEPLRLIDANGPRNMRERDAVASGLSANGVYDNGAWRVVFKRPLRTATPEIQFEEGRFIPIAFAAWDGSNGEKGSKHVMTPWFWLRLEPPADRTAYVWPIVAGILAFAAEWAWLVKRP